MHSTEYFTPNINNPFMFQKVPSQVHNNSSKILAAVLQVIVDQSLLNTASVNPVASSAHTAVVPATGVVPSPAVSVPLAAPVVVSVPIPRDPAVVTSIPVVAPAVANPEVGAVVNPVLPTVDDDAPMQAANTIPQVSWVLLTNAGRGP